MIDKSSPIPCMLHCMINWITSTCCVRETISADDQTRCQSELSIRTLPSVPETKIMLLCQGHDQSHLWAVACRWESMRSLPQLKGSARTSGAYRTGFCLLIRFRLIEVLVTRARHTTHWLRSVLRCQRWLNERRQGRQLRRWHVSEGESVRDTGSCPFKWINELVSELG